MKVLVTDSVYWQGRSVGKGPHDLPRPVAESLINAGLATVIIEIDTSIRTVNVDDKNNNGGNIKRGQRSRSKKPVQGRSLQ